MEPGRVLSGRYQLEHEIGSGGAAVVWRARDRALGRAVAIKLLRPELERDEATVERFHREARSAAALNHRHAVAIYDIGIDEDEVFIVMEHVDGPGLDVLTGRGPLAADAVTAVGYQVASALGAAHGLGLVHRDVKPANILLAPDGHAKVADFGIAKAVDADHTTLTRLGTVVGTVAYLSPEQLTGDEVDPRTDVYALGLVLHEALTGTLPFGEGTPSEVTARRLASDPPPLDEFRPDLAPALCEVVARSTRRDPEERFGDGAALAAALEPLVEDDPAVLVGRLVRKAQADQDGGGDATSRGRDDTMVLTAPPLAEADTVTVARTDDEHAVGDGERADGSRMPPVLPEIDEERAARDPMLSPDVRKAVLAGLGVLVALLVAWSIVAGPSPSGDGDGGGGGGGDGRDEPRPVEVETAQDFDPHSEDGEEHREDVAKAHDGDPGTAWVTERYDSADMGGLKPGVGLWFDLGAPRDLGRIELTLSPGIDLEVYAGTAEPSGTDSGGWGTQVGSVSGASESASIEVPEDVEARFVLVWVTSVGGAGERAEIAEVRFIDR